MEIINFPAIISEWADAYGLDVNLLKAAYIQGIKAGGNENLAISRAAMLFYHLIGEQPTEDEGLLRLAEGNLSEPEEEDLLDDGDDFNDTGMLASTFLAELDEAISDLKSAQDFILKHALIEQLTTITSAKDNGFKPSEKVVEQTLTMLRKWQKTIPQITDEKLEILRSLINE